MTTVTGGSDVRGRCDERFEAVRSAFAGGFAGGPELGASLAVVVDGELVVDLHGGFRDAARAEPWSADTLVNVASTGKGFVSTALHRLVERGEVDLDQPVSSLWPEFAAEGKGAITVAQLLEHSAGLPALREPLPAGSIYRWDAVTDALAAEAPWWEPGTRHGYHVISFGFLVGEVIRRVTGRTPGRFIADELGAEIRGDYFIGLPESEEHRVAEVPPIIQPAAGGFNPFADADASTQEMMMKAFTFPGELVDPGVVNTRAWRAAEVPASNPQGNARGLAKLYGALVRSDQPVLRSETLDLAIDERVNGIDAVLGMPDRFALGFMLPSEMRPFGHGPRVFGHTGAGGSLGFADPDRRLGFGYAPNQTIAAGVGGDPRWPVLIDAVYQALELLPGLGA